MFQRVPQPAVNPALRDAERHEFWPGFITLVVGAVLTLFGAQRWSTVDTVQGESARETQLIKAFSSGGLRYPEKFKPPPPPDAQDPGAAAEALERWARQEAAATPPTWKLRVDPAAQTPCPT